MSALLGERAQMQQLAAQALRAAPSDAEVAGLISAGLHGTVERQHVGRMLIAEAALAGGWGAPGQWLRQARECFQAHGLHHLSRHCARLLGEAPGWIPDGVTAREHDVLELVAAGLANRQVAIRLHLSVRTVEKHVESLLRKTGARSRTRVSAPGAKVAVVTWAEAERCETCVVIAALGALLPPPPPGAGGPFALSGPGKLEELLTAAGSRPAPVWCPRRSSSRISTRRCAHTSAPVRPGEPSSTPASRRPGTCCAARWSTRSSATAAPATTTHTATSSRRGDNRRG